MTTAKKEARLSGMLLARKGNAAPSHIDHRLNVQVMDQFASEQSDSILPERNIPKELMDGFVNSDDHDVLQEALKEIRDVHQKQTSGQKQEILEETIDENVSSEAVSVEVPVVSRPEGRIKNKKTSAKGPVLKKNASSKRIAMTLRMEQDDHLKLRLFAAHTRKSCQEIISEALDLYMNKCDQPCSMEDCTCLSR